MKRMSSVACAAATVICGWMTGVQAGVVAYYDFAGSGTNDASGHGFSLTSAGSVVFANGAAVFNGTEPYLSSDALMTGTYSSLTVEFYMRTTNLANKQILELSSDMNSNPNVFDFYYLGGADNAYTGYLYGWYKPGGNVNVHSSTGYTVSDGNWHHVALVIDASKASTADYVTLYLDRRACTAVSLDNTMSVIRNDRIYIGARNGNTDSFAGQLDDLRISDTALSTNDFLKARSEQLPILAYYRFDSTNALADASGNGRALTVGAGSAASFTNDMAVFNGSAPYLSASGIFSSATYSNATVEFYMRTTHTVDKQILELGPNFFTDAYKGVFDFYTESGKLRSWYTTIPMGPQGAFLSSASVNDGYWHHVAMVIDAAKAGADTYVTMYVDRQPYLSGIYGVANLLNEVLYIGSRTGSQDSFVGQLDDVRICSAALPPEQFLPARTGATVVPPEVIAYWKFDDGNPLADSSGNGYTLTNATGMTTDKCSAVFNGTQVCNTARTLNLAPYGDLTIEFFVKTTAAQNKQILELSSNYINYDGSWDFYYHGATEGGAVHGIFNTGGDGFNHHCSSGSIANGNWHHVALVIDSSKADTAGYVQVYLDKTAAPYFGANSENQWARSPLRSDTVYIGGRSLNTDLFTGQLDDVKITAAALPVSAFMTKRSTPQGTFFSIN